ncbi:hypothetical protein M0R19_00150 [Candidatus Pacearchaeota archaeon]|nr:hypothetical protein [Candidatus Pacearchaeota archaeon]
MAQEQVDYAAMNNDLILKIRDIEAKQRVMKDRLLLVGQNLVEMKENSNVKILEIKKDVEKMKQELEKLSSFLETVSGEFSKFAKKDDLELLTKQAKMFQPMEFVTKEDLEKLRR